MENRFSFMPNYLQIASFFVHGETCNQQESMIFLAVCKCSRLCVNFGVGTSRVRTYFWPNLNPPLEHLIKVVLIAQKLLLRGKIKKVLSRAHVCSLK